MQKPGTRSVLRARYYDPTIGRWISQDPLGFDPGDSNLYRYVNNWVTNVTDPSGFQMHPIQTTGGPHTYPDVSKMKEWEMKLWLSGRRGSTGEFPHATRFYESIERRLGIRKVNDFDENLVEKLGDSPTHKALKAFFFFETEARRMALAAKVTVGTHWYVEGLKKGTPKLTNFAVLDDTATDTKKYNCFGWAYGEKQWLGDREVGFGGKEIVDDWYVAMKEGNLKFVEDRFSAKNYQPAQLHPKINLGAPLSNAKTYVALYGYVDANTNMISEITHAAIRYSNTPVWQSKLGKGPLIAHESLQDLEGDGFGKVIAIFMK